MNVTTVRSVSFLVVVLVLVPQPLSVAWEPPERYSPGGLLTSPVVDNLEPYRERHSAGNVETFEDYARSLVSSDDEWDCLHDLWWHESKWDPNAEGPTNDHGIPQANADAHPETSESRWRADGFVQVRWGVGYITNRYGSMCAAWEAWKGRGLQRDDGSWWGGWY